MINQKLYEAIRWTIAIFIPAFEVLLTTLQGAWGWQIPIDAINATLSAIALFLGAIFGISKIAYDKKTNAIQAESESQTDK